MTWQPRAVLRRPAQVTALGVALGLLFSFALTLVSPAAPASAHAYVIATSPANGSSVDTAPTEITVTFDEPVTLNGQSDATTVIDSEGTRHDAGTAVLDAARTTLTIALAPSLPKDSYIASWSVVSADTHPVGGSLQFGYGVPASTLDAPPPPQPSAVLTLAVGVAKGLLYLGLVVAFGLLPAALLLGSEGGERRRVVRIAWVGAGVAILASAGQLAVQFLWIASAAPPLPPGAVWGSLVEFARSSYGIAVGVRVAALLGAALVLIGRPGRWRLAAFFALGLVAVGTITENGHGGAGPWWQFWSTVLHASGAIAWTGGLLVLGWLLLRRQLDADRLRRMPRWSLYAGISAAVLAASGVVQALVEVEYPAALFTTTYGVLLQVKILLVLAALGLGAGGYLWTRKQLRATTDGRPEPGQTARLRGRVRWEAGITAVVIVVSGVLSSITPAKADYAPTAVEHRKIGPYQVTLEVGPARRGPQAFRITAVQPTEASPLPQEVQVVLSQADGPVKDLAVSFPYRIPGVVHAGKPTPILFASSAVTVPSTGVWTASVTVVASQFDQYTATISYRVE